MSVTFTFGSLGDIIALTGLINELIEVLDDSRGSVKDYSGVVFRLRIQLIAVNRVEQLFGRRARNQKDAEIQVDVRQVLQRIRECIDDFLAKLAKFAPSLSNGGSGNNVKDILKKVSWRLERKEIEAFERNIMIHTASLDVFIGVTTWYAVESVRDQLSDQTAALEAQSSSLRQLQAFMVAIGSALLFKLNQVAHACQDIQRTTAQGLLVGLTMLPRLQVITGQLERIPLPLEGIHFVLIDHLGGQKKIPLDIILSWGMFCDFLAKTYETKKGARRLARQRFALEQNSTSKEIDKKTPWESAFRHSQVVHLSLECRQVRFWENGRRCPGCHFLGAEMAVDAAFKCSNCSLQFLVLFESQSSEPVQNSIDRTVQVRKTSGPVYAESGREETTDDSDEEDISGLTRIRVLASEPRGMMSAVFPQLAWSRSKNSGRRKLSDDESGPSGAQLVAIARLYLYFKRAEAMGRRTARQLLALREPENYADPETTTPKASSS